MQLNLTDIYSVNEKINKNTLVFFIVLSYILKIAPIYGRYGANFKNIITYILGLFEFDLFRRSIYACL